VILAATWDTGGLGRSGQEVLGAATTLAAALGETVTLAALGHDAGATAAAAGAYGAAHAVAFDGAVEREAAVDALAELARELGTRAVLLVGDERGGEIGPRLAQRLGGTAITHALALDVANGQPVWTRPVFGGKALAAVRTTAEPVVATLRRGAFAAAVSTNRTVEVETRPAPGAADVVELLEVAPPAAGIAIDQAPVIVCGGRGLGEGESFGELEELAGLLGGAVGASLAAVDAGWAPADRQVGLTGKTVSPDLYFAFGISGASQHLAGIGGAKVVVAVNTDAEAPIFGRARLGVVMDCRKLLPALIEELRRRAPAQ
jgi:electron transfer flavoprotein alpha subunit